MWVGPPPITPSLSVCRNLLSHCPVFMNRITAARIAPWSSPPVIDVPGRRSQTHEGSELHPPANAPVGRCLGRSGSCSRLLFSARHRGSGNRGRSELRRSGGRARPADFTFVMENKVGFGRFAGILITSLYYPLFLAGPGVKDDPRLPWVLLIWI